MPAKDYFIIVDKTNGTPYITRHLPFETTYQRDQRAVCIAEFKNAVVEWAKHQMKGEETIILHELRDGKLVPAMEIKLLSVEQENSVLDEAG